MKQSKILKTICVEIFEINHSLKNRKIRIYDAYIFNATKRVNFQFSALRPHISYNKIYKYWFSTLNVQQNVRS